MRNHKCSSDEIGSLIARNKRTEELFGILTGEETLVAKKAMARVDYGKKEVVIKGGVPVSHVYFLVEGLLDVSQAGSGEQAILNYILPGDCFGTCCTADEKAYNFTVSACSDSTVLAINKEDFHILLFSNKNFMYRILQLTAQNQVAVYQRLASSMVNRLPGRIARALLFFSEKVFRADSYILPVTKKELARYAGASRERLHRTLCQFDDDGIISLSGNTIRIIKPGMLARLAVHG